MEHLATREPDICFLLECKTHINHSDSERLQMNANGALYLMDV